MNCLFVDGSLRGRTFLVPDHQDTVAVVPLQPVDPGAPGEFRVAMDVLHPVSYRVDRSDSKQVTAYLDEEATT